MDVAKNDEGVVGGKKEQRRSDAHGGSETGADGGDSYKTDEVLGTCDEKRRV